jgi:hypothetical protein
MDVAKLIRQAFPEELDLTTTGSRETRRRELHIIIGRVMEEEARTSTPKPLTPRSQMNRKNRVPDNE